MKKGKEMDHNKIGVCLVGYGVMGAIYVKKLKLLTPKVELLYIVGTKEGPLSDYCSTIGGCTPCTDIQVALKDSKVNCIIISSPDESHSDLVRRSLDSGKHVLCEKPLTLSSQDARICHDLAIEKGLILLTAFNRRHDHSFSQVKKRLDAGLVGRVELIKTVSRDPLIKQAVESSIEPTQQVHPIWNSLIHDFDMAVWLAGVEEVEEVTAFQTQKHCIVVVIKFANGVLAVIDWAKGIGDTLKNQIFKEVCNSFESVWVRSKT